MKSYFEKVGKKANNAKEKLSGYWNRFMRSNHIKISEGAHEQDKTMTSAHKDQWRRPKA